MMKRLQSDTHNPERLSMDNFSPKADTDTDVPEMIYGEIDTEKVRETCELLSKIAIDTL
ncbi:hypothetical protein MK079_01255 [Candidatus Gracilibacteria bacterium]|nr:hypothetical protein [Candidatus Gracilibacteria bacterium]